LTLPKVYSPIEPVEIGGVTFEVRSLTRAEQFQMQKMVEQKAPADESEIAMIAYATDTSIEEVREWYGKTPGWAINELIAVILKVSRLDEGAQKSS
jgi:hypothetical protein